MRIDLEDGKYTYVLNDDESGSQYALRYGEPWRDLTGDKFVYCMAAKIEEQTERIKDLEAALLPPGSTVVSVLREQAAKQSAALKLARDALDYYTPMIRSGDSPAEQALAAIDSLQKGE